MDATTLSLLEAGGLAIFIWYLFRALSQQVSGLKELVAAQKQTIEVMERRVAETEKIGNIYKALLADLPSDLENYKRIVSTTKDATIHELQSRHAVAERQLEDARAQLLITGPASTQGSRQLAQLRTLMSGQKHAGDEEAEYNLKRIAETLYTFVDRALPVINRSESVTEFLQASGKRLTVVDDESIVHAAFDTGHLPDGKAVDYTFASSVSGQRYHLWYVITPDVVFANARMADALTEEFVAVKNAA